ncbi:hypothetical protein R1sor_001507 [Riccia sorocarpa]|uniref:Uncharacterized protein n=1 Tax=Riccia sorocarpa TaxID=122646 RepID=A0ABD3GZJ2_9MARC
MNSKALLSSAHLFRVAAVRPPVRTGRTSELLPRAPLVVGTGRLPLVAYSSGTASPASRHVLQEEGETGDMEGKQEPPQQPGAERPGYREDMSDSYGEAYSIRSSDEGYGEIYGEAVKKYQSNPDIKEVQRGMTAERDQVADAFGGTKSGEEYDRTQGHPVAEKEKGRHATHERAFQSTTPTLQKGGGAAT